MLLDELLKPKLLIFKMIWLAMTFSMAILVILTFLLANNARVGNSNIAFANLAIPGAFFCLLAFFAIRKIFLSDNKLKVQLEKQVEAKLLAINPATGIINENTVQKIELLSELEKRLLSSLPNWYFLPFLLGLVFSDAIAILGFVLAIVKGNPNFILPFAGLSIALNLANYPKFDSMIERAKNFNMCF